MGLRDKMLTCPVLEEEGVWFDILDTGSSFLCRRFRGVNGPLAEVYREVIQPFYVEDEGGKGDFKLETPEAQSALIDFWAKHIILDWRNVTAYDVHGDGHPEEPEPYTPEACAKMLKEIREVFTVLAVETTYRENYLLERRKKQVGN